MTSVSASAGFADDLGTIQQNTVKGTVKDATTGEALIGVINYLKWPGAPVILLLKI